MRITLKNALRMVFASCLFVGIFSASANANEYCPSDDKAFEMFQNMTADLEGRGIGLSLVPKTCVMVVQVVKEGESINNGLLKITWQMKTMATVYYVWTGEQYQFLDFGELYTQTKAPMGDWSPATHAKGREKQEIEIRTIFTVTYFFVKGR